MMKRPRPLKTHSLVLAALVFSLATLGAGQQSPQIAVPSEDVKPITLAVGVEDQYGRHVAELKKENFTLYDQKVQQAILAFDAQDSPASVAVVFDVSSSMLSRGNFVGLLRNSVLSFIQQSNRANDYLIIGFADSVQLLADLGSSDETLVRALNELGTAEPKKGRTLLHDACYLGLEKLKGGAHPRRVLLLMTDGWDDGSRRTLDELHRALKDSDVVVYSVALGSDRDSEQSDTSMLKRLAEISGGRAFFPTTSAEADEAFARIRLQVQHQYLITYRPSNVLNDGKWHKLKVALKTPLRNLSARTREGYYPAGSLPAPGKP